MKRKITKAKVQNKTSAKPVKRTKEDKMAAEPVLPILPVLPVRAKQSEHKTILQRSSLTANTTRPPIVL